MKIVFFGSSDFSIPSLEICRRPPHEILAVITTPPKPRGRGLREAPGPVQLRAEREKLPLFAPPSLKDPDFASRIAALRPDLFVVASYGKMIPPSWLKIPTRGRFNVHPSLLPKYRGAAPINWPILNGDSETGVSIAEVTEKLDAGDLFIQKRVPIPDEVHAADLEKMLAEKSAEALAEALDQAETGSLRRTPQEEGGSCYARKLTKEDGRIDWSQPAATIARQVRGLVPWPAAFTLYQNAPLQILTARVRDPDKLAGRPGELLAAVPGSEGFEVQTGKGTLKILKVKPAGKKEMPALDFLNGQRLQPGCVFGE